MSIRWLFNLRGWRPTLDQIRLSFACLQPEERARISRFHYQRDAQSSLIGRLLMRKICSEMTQTPYNLIKFDRDGDEKPILVHPPPPASNLSFNISHQGDYVVLGAEMTPKTRLGIDVMRVEMSGNKLNLEEYFRLMRRQFTESEWVQIKKGSESKQLENFIRHWTLKESYVKAIGLGLKIPLTSIDFQINSELILSKLTTDTTLKVNGILLNQWTFEEMKIDSDHIVAVAIENRISKPTDENYKVIDFEELMEGAKVQEDEGDSVKLAQEFLDKPFSPFSNVPDKEIKAI